MNGEENCATVSERDKQVQEDLWQRHKAEHGVWTEPMLKALERGVKGNKWFSLIDKCWTDRTLGLAWEKVQANAGCCGVDGITIEQFAKNSQSRLLAVKEQIKAKLYQPKSVKRVWIPKLGSAEKRPLGIPTVVDRVVQSSIKMVIEPIFEKEFSPNSYGFRPGRGCKDALRRVEELLRAGNLYVVDVDIKGYFDSIPHERLMGLVRERIADGQMLELLEKILKQGIVDGEQRQEAQEKGTPQGGIISPLLANLYLNPLDWLLTEQGFNLVRYADDMVVLCRTKEEAQKALEELREWMKGAELTLHPEKTRLVNMNQADSRFDFLGYRFKRSRRGKLLKLVRPKSLSKLREQIKPRTKRANGRSIEAIVKDINRTLSGWFAYFKHAHVSNMKETDQWIRARLRSILRKRNHGRGRAHGSDHQRWPNHYFNQLGLFCLREARERERFSLQTGANH